MGRFTVVAAAIAAVFLGLGTPHAAAASWCGPDQVVPDRPDTFTGAQLHVLYAYPADGGNDFGTWAPRIVEDVERIDAWWRGQDAARTPRFDLAAFPDCGGFGALDLGVLQLSLPGSALQPLDNRFQTVFREVVRALPTLSPWKKVVVYYDGPIDKPDVCGTGGGSPETGSDSLAVVWTRSQCEDRPERRAWVAAHEIVHELGAPTGQEPHPYTGDAGHVGDSGSDLMFPFVGDTIDQAVLDVGRDDYYRHGGSWFDLATSAWLRRLDLPQQPLTVAIAGGAGRVISDLPGVDCVQTCTTQWDDATAVTLDATPGDNERFLGWQGGCTGDPCTVTLSAPVSVEARFGPAEVRLTARVTGRGTVVGDGISCPKRCRASVTAGDPHTLRAKPAKGWKLVRWSGGCRGTKLACTVRPEVNTAVQARFALAKPLRPKR